MENMRHRGWGLVLVCQMAMAAGIAEVASAADLTLPVGGKVTIELLSASAEFHNTMSIVSPGGSFVVDSGCKVEASPNLSGTKIVSENISVHGCRVTLDAAVLLPGVQPFAAGTTLELNLCAQTDDDATCEYIWSSQRFKNEDSFDHLRITPVRAAEFPDRIFQLAWEDAPFGGDQDFNDLIAVVRVETDTDGDGLWDDWERFGADTNGDGTIDLDLPALGANPNHKDIFVEIDWMDCTITGGDCPTGDTHNHRPKAAAVAAAIAAFADANVTNPDGVNGITLHVDVGNSIRHQNALVLDNACFRVAPGVGSFNDVKADPANFGPNNPRRFAYHYGLFTHQQLTTTDSSGCGELPGNDFQVSFGTWNAPKPNGSRDYDGDGLSDTDEGTVQEQAGTIIHELGHNLGLRHGGADHIHRKPNFISAMNYTFQTVGIPPVDPDGAGPLMGRVDYSRAKLASLDEMLLAETAGVGAGSDNSIFYCPNFTSGTILGSNAADWNCNTVFNDTNVTADINGDRICIDVGLDGTLNSTPGGDDLVQLSPFRNVPVNVIVDGPDRTCNSTRMGDDDEIRAINDKEPKDLVGFTDWTNILFDMQRTVDFEEGNSANNPRLVEVDYALHLASLRADLQVAMSASPPLVLTGNNLTYEIKVTNVHPGAATKVVLSDTLPTGTTFVSCSATHGGVCAGSGNARTVTFEAIPGAETATVTIVANVTCSLPNGQTITNSATVVSAEDTNPANDSAEASAITSNPPPVIGPVTASLPYLWPPNHKLVSENIAYTATDNCGVPACQLSVTSSEPINGTGDGDTAPDWVIINDHNVSLRAERSGGGGGRIYAIKATCSDSASSSATSQPVPVHVTH